MELESSTSPNKIGPYPIEELLDEGGMSVLYLGRNPETNERLIVKTLSQKFLSNPDVTRRFLAEAEIIALADHPNIVRLYGSGKWEGGLYIAMEYVHGITLRHFLQNTPLSLKRALEILLGISYALCHLHTHHVIHRDLKPENILIASDGKVKVIDFGIAQLLYSSSINQEEAETKRFIGTPIYMSPEQREDPTHVSYPSDIYSLGIIAYELIIGRISQGQIHLSLLPKGLQKIIAHTLLPLPEERYHDVVDFISDISHYFHSSSLEKEKRPQDHLIEEVEKMKDSLRPLLQPSPPSWEGFEIKLTPQTDINPFSIGWMFFETQSKKGFLLLKAVQAKMESLALLMHMKGILEGNPSLYDTPESLVKQLNSTLLSYRDKPLFQLSYLAYENSQWLFLSANGATLTLNDQNILPSPIPLGEEKTPLAPLHTLAKGPLTLATQELKLEFLS